MKLNWFSKYYRFMVDEKRQNKVMYPVLVVIGAWLACMVVGVILQQIF